MAIWEEWGKIDIDADPPYCLPHDHLTIKCSKWSRDLCGLTAIRAAALGGHAPGNTGDKRLHFGRIPTPYLGDLRNAKVYILTLNPGHQPIDYWWDFQRPDFREAMKRNLKQIQPVKFDFLNPEFAGHPGSKYWKKKFKDVIDGLTSETVTPHAAQAKIASATAVIQLVPYPSVKGDGVAELSDRLESTLLAKMFVKKHVLKKVRNREAIAVVLRQRWRWNAALDPRIGPKKGIFRNQNPRNAHLPAEAKKVIIQMLS